MPAEGRNPRGLSRTPASGRVIPLFPPDRGRRRAPAGQPDRSRPWVGSEELASLPLRRPRPRRPGWRLWALGLSAVLLLGIAGVLGLAARDVRGALARPEPHPVRRGTLELAVAGEALLLRNEWVQVAPRGGTLERLVPEGQAVRTGTPVVTVAGQPLRAERPGTLSYQIDGLETELDPDALGWVTGAQATGPGPDWLERIPFRRVEPPSSQVAPGQPVFKVVDNAGLWLAVTGPARLLAGVNPGDPARVQFLALGTGLHRFRVVYKSAPEGDQVLLALAADSPIPDTLAFLRRTPVRVVLGRWEGWVVPREALTVVGGRPGVLVRTPAGERFVPVTVLGQNETEAAVEGDLAPDAEVLVPPGDAVWS